MSCKDSIKYTCGTKLNARCVDYEGVLSSCTTLPSCTKFNLHDVVEDIQGVLTDLCTKLDISNIDTSCDPLEVNKISDILNNVYSKICSLEDRLPENKCQDLGDTNIECLNLDFSCLIPADPCGDLSPKTVKEFFQFLIDQQCQP